jgi:hypothetical protein
MISSNQARAPDDEVTKHVTGGCITPLRRAWMSCTEVLAERARLVVTDDLRGH